MKTKTKENLFMGFLVVLMLIGIIVVFNNITQPSFDTDDYYIDTYVVESGDTLWEIGSKYCSNHDDIREWIYEVEDLNNCTANIRPHQCLTIYVAKDLEED